RRLVTFADDAMHDHVVASSGIRLPLDFDAGRFAADATLWAAKRVESTRGGDKQRERKGDAVIEPVQSPISNLLIPQSRNPAINPEQPTEYAVAGALTSITLRFSSYEPAWRGDRSNLLVRSFLHGLREVAPAEKLGFVLKTGTSDMNVVGPAWECPIVAYGPGDSSLDHTPHEHLSLDDYGRAVFVLEAALRSLGDSV
ncbi:MAG: hypothetical protein R6W76_00595, partial [Caldilinea sp.]